MEIAWIGTGIMGAPMARRLHPAGHRVRVYNRSPEKARPVAADGAIVCADLPKRRWVLRRCSSWCRTRPMSKLLPGGWSRWRNQANS